MREGSPAGPALDPSEAVAARLPVTEVRHWLVLLGIALVCAGVLAWLVLGSAAEGVSGRGFVVPADGFREIGADVDGYVEEIRVRPGDPVTAGQVIAVVRADDGRRAEAAAPSTGAIVTVLVREGTLSLQGDAIATMESDAGDLIIAAFLPAGPAKRVATGMEAGIALDFVPVSEHGRLVGLVEAVAPVPASAERVLLLTGGNAELAAYFLDAGPVLEVSIRPVADASTPSGYRWSVGSGPDITLSAGALADATVYVTDSAPLARLLQ